MQPLRHDWTYEQVKSLFELPLNDLIFEAQKAHREYFSANEIQVSTLLSIKTGSCPEDCAYCPQSGHYNTGLKKEKLIPLETVIEHAKAAKASGATRFCMGAAWRNPPKKDMPQVAEMIKAVRDLGLETCVTLGMLDDEDAGLLKEAGLDYYNHNLDSSPDYYKKIITTRTYQDRLDTLKRVRDSGIKVCCGGIVGMGETREDRIQFLLQLANLPEHPESVPINHLIQIKGTPLEECPTLDAFEFVRMIGIARIMMPSSWVRIAAGREEMSEELQMLCFLAGANSIFYGEKLLTAKNPGIEKDNALMEKAGLCRAPGQGDISAHACCDA